MNNYAYPTPQEYNESIQNPASCFFDPALKSGKVDLNQFGLPRPSTGAFASVYRLRCENADYALKCFLEPREDREKRYLAIAEYCQNLNMTALVPFRYIEQGIKIKGGSYPLLQMDWVEGVSLDRYICAHLSDARKLRMVQEVLRSLAHVLTRNSVAHGDLQHGNILVSQNGLKLIDYDGMFVPELRDYPSPEMGHRNFQHPRRREAQFDRSMDNFALWVIDITFRLILRDPILWTEFFGGEDTLLFRYSDFLHPEISPLFLACLSHEDDEIVSAATLLLSLIELSPDSVPPLIASDSDARMEISRLAACEIISSAEEQSTCSPQSADQEYIDYARLDFERFSRVENKKKRFRKFGIIRLARRRFKSVLHNSISCLVGRLLPGHWAKMMLDRADEAFFGEDFALAIQYLDAVLERFKDLPGYKQLVCQIMIRLGICYVESGQTGTAAHYFRECLNEAELQGLSEEEFKARLLTAVSYVELGQKERAIEMLDARSLPLNQLLTILESEDFNIFSRRESTLILLIEFAHVLASQRLFTDASIAYAAFFRISSCSDSESSNNVELADLRASLGMLFCRQNEMNARSEHFAVNRRYEDPEFLLDIEYCQDDNSSMCGLLESVLYSINKSSPEELSRLLLEERQGALGRESGFLDLILELSDNLSLSGEKSKVQLLREFALDGYEKNFNAQEYSTGSVIPIIECLLALERVEEAMELFTSSIESMYGRIKKYAFNSLLGEKAQHISVDASDCSIIEIRQNASSSVMSEQSESEYENRSTESDHDIVRFLELIALRLGRRVQLIDDIYALAKISSCIYLSTSHVSINNCRDRVLNSVLSNADWNRALESLHGTIYGMVPGYGELCVNIARDLKEHGEIDSAISLYGHALRCFQSSGSSEYYSSLFMECLLDSGDCDQSAALLLQCGEIETSLKLLYRIMTSKASIGSSDIQKLLECILEKLIGGSTASTTIQEVELTLKYLSWCAASEDSPEISKAKEKVENWKRSRELESARALLEQGQFAAALSAYEQQEGPSGPSVASVIELWIMKYISMAIMERGRGFTPVADGYALGCAVELLDSLIQRKRLSVIFARQVCELIRISLAGQSFENHGLMNYLLEIMRLLAGQGAEFYPVCQVLAQESKVLQDEFLRIRVNHSPECDRDPIASSPALENCEPGEPQILFGTFTRILTGNTDSLEPSVNKNYSQPDLEDIPSSKQFNTISLNILDSELRMNDRGPHIFRKELNRVFFLIDSNQLADALIELRTLKEMLSDYKDPNDFDYCRDSLGEILLSMGYCCVLLGDEKQASGFYQQTIRFTRSASRLLHERSIAALAVLCQSEPDRERCLRLLADPMCSRKDVFRMAGRAVGGSIGLTADLSEAVGQRMYLRAYEQEKAKLIDTARRNYRASLTVLGVSNPEHWEMVVDCLDALGKHSRAAILLRRSTSHLIESFSSFCSQVISSSAAIATENNIAASSTICSISLSHARANEFTINDVEANLTDGQNRILKLLNRIAERMTTNRDFERILEIYDRYSIDIVILVDYALQMVALQTVSRLLTVELPLPRLEAQMQYSIGVLITRKLLVPVFLERLDETINSRIHLCNRERKFAVKSSLERMLDSISSHVHKPNASLENIRGRLEELNESDSTPDKNQQTGNVKSGS